MIYRPGDVVTISAWEPKPAPVAPGEIGLGFVQVRGLSGSDVGFDALAGPNPGSFYSGIYGNTWRLQIQANQLGSSGLALGLTVPQPTRYVAGRRVRYQVVQGQIPQTANSNPPQFAAILDVDFIAADQPESQFAVALDSKGRLWSATSNSHRTRICLHGDTLDQASERGQVEGLYDPYLWIDAKNTLWLAGLGLMSPSGAGANLDREQRVLFYSRDGGRTWNPSPSPHPQPDIPYDISGHLLQPGANVDERFAQSIGMDPINELLPTTTLWSAEAGSLWLSANLASMAARRYISRDDGGTWSEPSTTPSGAAAEGQTSQSRLNVEGVLNRRLELIPGGASGGTLKITPDRLQPGYLFRNLHLSGPMGQGQLLMDRASQRLHVLYSNTKLHIPTTETDNGLGDGLQHWISSDDLGRTWHDRTA